MNDWLGLFKMWKSGLLPKEASKFLLKDFEEKEED